MTARRLHIGGKVRHPDWEVIDALPGPHVDHTGNAADLSRFPDATFEAVYASHVLEHFDYAGAMEAALKEWRRVLEPGGTLYVSVPDLDVLAGLFLKKDALSVGERFHVMRMIFGGHTTPYDYHQVGLNAEFLALFLTRAGFSSIRRQAGFGLFHDTSTLIFGGVPISLNITAVRPPG